MTKKQYLSVSNEKMKKSSNDNKLVVSWGIPAGVTCPNAGACKIGCYAMGGNYLRPNVKKAVNDRWELSKTEYFIPVIDGELAQLQFENPDKDIYVRIHDTGDFYNVEYTRKWFKIAELNPSVKFYAYTKMVGMFQELKDEIPDNFTIVYSYGGTEDALINPDTDKHARVFETVDDLNRAGYVDCSNDDLMIFHTDKVGLVYHGARNWVNTGFSQP